jgi:AcrR family transcriptional regulator
MGVSGKRQKRARHVRPGPVGAEEAQARTEFIIKIATEEFLTKGFEGATLSSIARQCRISKSTLYSVFESKEALLGHVAMASIDNFSYDLKQALDSRRPLRDVIRNVVVLMSDAQRDKSSRDLLRLIVTERERFPSVGSLTMRRTFELLRPLAEYLKSVSTDSHLSTEAALRYAYHLMSMAIGGFGTLFSPPERLYGDVEAWIDSVTRAFLDKFPLAADA